MGYQYSSQKISGEISTVEMEIVIFSWLNSSQVNAHLLVEYKSWCFSWVTPVRHNELTLQQAFIHTRGYTSVFFFTDMVQVLKIFDSGTHLWETFSHFPNSDKYAGTCWILAIICLLWCRQCIKPICFVLCGKGVGRQKKYSEQQMVDDMITEQW